jgi:hypothetical protein
MKKKYINHKEELFVVRNTFIWWKEEDNFSWRSMQSNSPNFLKRLKKTDQIFWRNIKFRKKDDDYQMLKSRVYEGVEEKVMKSLEKCKRRNNETLRLMGLQLISGLDEV